MDETTIAIAATFTLAGSVKGVIGLGLPTIAVGLLTLMMPPAHAAALLIVPSTVTICGSSRRARASRACCAGSGRCCSACASAPGQEVDCSVCLKNGR
jgi:hypothetical protein